MSKFDSVYSLAKILGCSAKYDEPMSNHTTFKIGGNADVFISIGSEQELKIVLNAAKECETNRQAHITNINFLINP